MKETAIHEAGHAVAHYRLQIDGGEVSIIPKDGIIGRAFSSDTIWDKSDAENQVLAFCSGYAALVAAGYSRIAREGCNNDFEEATAIIEAWHLGTLDEWLIKSVKFMCENKNIIAVEMLARDLLKLDHLDFDYCMCLIDFADGELTKPEWERYLEVRQQLKV